ncbi:hypothetical protein BJ322DRAFT_811137 [Thelephora terrestris]|uniref:Uncharacterized protein n=1 Tax=Thelephora terrestris TaxID=56493 RepID=A0A9P6HE97_9AGAM|nr:hypothetical protein BJ322DRAFT_811137 [Thelephora terrestris]
MARFRGSRGFLTLLAPPLGLGEEPHLASLAVDHRRLDVLVGAVNLESCKTFHPFSIRHNPDKSHSADHYHNSSDNGVLV